MRCVQWGKRIAQGWSLALLCGAFGSLMVTACATSKERTQEDVAPFELVWAQAQPWVSGTQEGPSGIRLSFELSPPRTSVRFKSLCYMQQTASLISRPNKPDEFSASYPSALTKSDVKAGGCAIPALWQNEVNQPDQAVLVFEQEGLDHYFVIQDIVLKPLLAYPGRQ
jgi:hypothetical protein